jgi:hypothetical protein
MNFEQSRWICLRILSKLTGESDPLLMGTNLFFLEDTERYNAAFGR